MNGKRRPTRRDLLVVIGRLQILAGNIGGAAQDRNPNRAAELDGLARRMMAICLDATSHESPMMRQTGPYADDGHDHDWRREV